MTKSISTAQLKNFKNLLEKRNDHRVLERTVTQNGILASSCDYRAKVNTTPVFSIDLDTGKVADQKRSGRCWMFAALNTLRHDLRNRLNLPDEFELSQNFTFFWDKLEKANYFYENILKTAGFPTSDRKVAWLLATPQQDGGQWDMIMGLIEKYGVVPKSAMPETHNSSASSEFNSLLNLKLRKDAVLLRELVQNKATKAQIEAKKEKMLAEVYRMAAYSFGEPPATFDFEYRDQANNYHLDRNLTPKEFFDKYLGWETKDYISVINGPTDDKPFNHMYTVDMLGNVVGGREVRHLNVDMDTFKKLAIKQLEAGESVWFGCDVGKQSDRQKGLLAADLYATDTVFDIETKLSKKERLETGASGSTHAMTMVGVDVVAGKPRQWKIENSWGSKVGEKGYFVMDDKWFDEYLFKVVVKKKYLPKKLVEIAEGEATPVPCWDSMG